MRPPGPGQCPADSDGRTDTPQGVGGPPAGNPLPHAAVRVMHHVLFDIEREATAHPPAATACHYTQLQEHAKLINK